MMTPRLSLSALFTTQCFPPLQALGEALKNTGFPETTAALVHLRASQINGCGVCCDMHTRDLQRLGADDPAATAERLATVAAWRDAPYFTDAERAALALTEVVTRLADANDPVPDAVWNEAARHFDQTALAVLLLHIGLINLWNRVNVASRQVAGEWVKSQARSQAR